MRSNFFLLIAVIAIIGASEVSPAAQFFTKEECLVLIDQLTFKDFPASLEKKSRADEILYRAQLEAHKKWEAKSAKTRELSTEVAMAMNALLEKLPKNEKALIKTNYYKGEALSKKTQEWNQMIADTVHGIEKDDRYDYDECPHGAAQKALRTDPVITKKKIAKGTELLPLGTKREYSSGRYYHYSYAGVDRLQTDAYWIQTTRDLTPYVSCAIPRMIGFDFQRPLKGRYLKFVKKDHTAVLKDSWYAWDSVFNFCIDGTTKVDCPKNERIQEVQACSYYNKEGLDITVCETIPVDQVATVSAVDVDSVYSRHVEPEPFVSPNPSESVSDSERKAAYENFMADELRSRDADSCRKYLAMRAPREKLESMLATFQKNPIRGSEKRSEDEQKSFSSQKRQTPSTRSNANPSIAI